MIREVKSCSEEKKRLQKELSGSANSKEKKLLYNIYFPNLLSHNPLYSFCDHMMNKIVSWRPNPCLNITNVLTYYDLGLEISRPEQI